MSLVIDADGHVEESRAELVAAIPAAMQPHAMHFVSVSGGHVTAALCAAYNDWLD